MKLRDLFLRKPLMSMTESNLGNVLIKMGLISQKEIDAAITAAKMRHEDELLGRILVDRGCISQADLAEAVELQKQMRSGKESEAMLRIVERKTNIYHHRLLHPPTPKVA